MATNQFLVLDKISMEYHAFRKDQLLTHTQLNDLIDYFEDQDRLTRTCLIGVGLVCGLGVSYDAKVPSISVGKGCGVTTDGDLLVLEPSIFKHFKVYENKKKGTNDPIYDPFFPLPDGQKQIDLWELVIPDAKGELPLDSKGLDKFKSFTGKALDDLCALLYLEYYLQDPDKCTAIDCDNQGPLQVAKIKVLLLNKADMAKVINRDPVSEVIADSIYTKYHKAELTYFDLPLIKPKRVILNASNTVSIAMLAKSYTGIVQAGGGALISALSKLYAGFGFMVDPGGKTKIQDLESELQQALATHPRPYHAQYVYDYYKDILTAYNELREAVYNCMYECCPDRYAFPKHIMLGELLPTGVEPANYRHEWYPSPAVTDNKNRVAYCRSLWQRLAQMIGQFNLPDQPSAVKITPSADYDRMLENRAVPFYYKDVNALVKNWNYAWAKRGLEKNVLSYHAGQYAGGIDSTLQPLDYSIDANNFFRIEGHLGKQLADAMTAITRIRDEKGVPFDLVAIRINKAGNLKDINIDDFDCQFEDLNAILKAWLIEQNCLYANVSKFFSGFSTKKSIGNHTRLDDYRTEAQPMYLVAKKAAPAATEVVGISMLESSYSYNKDFVSSQPICKTIYTVDKTVVGNLETDADSLGVYFAETMKAQYLSGDDIVADVKRRTASDPDLLKLTADEREIVYEVPILLVSHVSEISQLKPFSIGEISTDLLEKYLQRMEKLCAYAKKLRSRLSAVFSNSTYSHAGYESYYKFLVQELIANCCAAEKLENLLDEINKRKQKILDSLLFANYYKQHAGLEHKAGTHRGGTFVLLYVQQLTTRNSTTVDTQDATGALNRVENLLTEKGDSISSKDSSLIDKNAYEDIDSFAYYLVIHQGKVNFDKEVQKYEKLHKIKANSLQDEIFNKQLAAKIKTICARLAKEEEATIAANVVVADFTLPYLCCSDCPPMVFIMPKQEFHLSLPKASVCSDDGAQLFKKEPFDGVVKATTGFEATIVDKGPGETYFDPSKVPVALFGKEIGFTINDQNTDCRITVFKHPKADFTAIVDKQSDDTIQVIFTNTSDDPTGKEYVYDWDFGDDRSPEKVTTTAPILVLYTKSVLIKLGLNGKIPVTLKASSGPCSETVIKDVPFALPVPVSLSLPDETVCNDTPAMPFTVQPATGVVASAEEPNSVVLTNGKYLFDPSKVVKFVSPITFTVNGKATTCKAVVFKHPTAAFDAKASLIPGVAANLMAVTFTNLSDPAGNQQLNYLWTFSDGTSKTMTSTAPFTLQFNMDVLKSQGQKELTAILVATNPGCDSKKETKVSFPLPAQLSCADTVKAAISSDRSLLGSTAIKSFLNSIKGTAQFPEISALLTDTISLETDALNHVNNFSQITLQAGLLRKIKAQLQRLYATKFEKSVNEIVVTPQIQAMLRLALLIVKCNNTDGVARELFISILSDFIAAIPTLIKLVPRLNSGGALTKFIAEYLMPPLAIDSSIEKEVKNLFEKIKANFPI